MPHAQRSLAYGRVAPEYAASGISASFTKNWASWPTSRRRGSTNRTRRLPRVPERSASGGASVRWCSSTGRAAGTGRRTTGTWTSQSSKTARSSACKTSPLATTRSLARPSLSLPPLLSLLTSFASSTERPAPLRLQETRLRTRWHRTPRRPRSRHHDPPSASVSRPVAEESAHPCLDHRACALPAIVRLEDDGRHELAAPATMRSVRLRCAEPPRTALGPTHLRLLRAHMESTSSSCGA